MSSTKHATVIATALLLTVGCVSDPTRVTTQMPEKSPLSDTIPESSLIRDTFLITEVKIGETVCAPYVYVSVERHVWIRKSQPKDCYRKTMVIRDKDGYHVILSKRPRLDDITWNDSMLERLGYTKAITVEVP